MQHKHTFGFLLFAFFIFGSHAYSQKKSFSKKIFNQHLEYLASDSLKGRKPGTPEGKLSAEYIKENLINIGFTPLGDDGFQYFNVVTNIAPANNSKISFISQSGNNDYIKSDKVTPMVISKSASYEGQLAFVGFGLNVKQKELDYNSYKNFHAKDKVLLILDGDPDIKNNDSPYLPYSGLRDKILNAEDQGASAVLFVKGSILDKKGSAETGYFDRAAGQAGIPVISLSRALADSLLIANHFPSIDSLENQLISDQHPNSIDFPLTVKGKAIINKEEVKTQNVIAFLEGKDKALKKEVILIGAHYDHLGMGGPGSGSRIPDTIAIHNGADDNASGVSGVLEIARRLEANKKKLKRSVIIMAFGAEEMGLIGSNFLTSHPEFEMADAKAMFNYDMIGRLDPEKKSILIGGTGTSKEAERILNQHKNNTKLKLAFSPEGYGASDHASFYAENIPVFFFSTGAHSDYHTPFDDADKINTDGAIDVLDYSWEVLMDIINRDQNLTWQESGPKKRQKYGRQFKVTLGIMPDFTSDQNNGLGVGGVTKDGPAYQGHMLKGDIITAIEGKSVKNIYDYMTRLKKLEPGQRISVDINRNGKHKILIVPL